MKSLRSSRIAGAGGWVAVVGALWTATGVTGAGAANASEEGETFFENHIRPLLVENCLRCHGERRPKGDVRLDSRAALVGVSERGPLVIPGDAERSPLIRAVRYRGEVRMPPAARLSATQIEALAAWVESGAPWPQGGVARQSSTPADDTHWAFRPIEKPPVPEVRDTGWPASAVDAFILAELEERGLGPSPPAERRVLIRRVTLDLTGLPPTPAEVAAFENDTSPGAYDRLVERLLASPRYGERWGRHWLDVARYADTKGYVFTEERRYAYSYTYRDYVIRAFNDDLPFDRFIVEQLAADRLEARGELGGDKRPLAALGFLTLGRRFSNNPHDIIADRIDVVTRGLMGLTVQCARCHDHKYDPIPIEDYYSLYGVFASSREPEDLPLLAEPEETPGYREYRKELSSRRGEVDKFLSAKQDELLAELRDGAGTYLAALVGSRVKIPEGAGLSLSAGELRPRVLQRWRNHLEKTRAFEDAVFSPWHQLASLAPEAFADRAVELVSRWVEKRGPAENSSSTAGPRLNGHVVKALAAQPPKTMGDVASVYGDLFREVGRRWNVATTKAGTTALDDGEWEELRQVLYAPGSPPTVTHEEAKRLFDRATRNKLRELQRKVDALKVTHPHAPPRPMLLLDQPQAHEPRIFVRGSPHRPGKQVPRRFPTVLASVSSEPFRDGSGRLELAQAVASKDNPLTARVIVNRVWRWHFGRGLVETPSDFGLRSEKPTHPELLDYLACQLIENGWSLKAIHRLLLLSSTYGQSSHAGPRQLEVDPENRWLGRMPRRRLEFEALRDSLLFVAGRLESTMGGRAVDMFKPSPSRHRTVYGFIDRQNLPELLRTFDFASPDATHPQRAETTVPQQALFLMNSPFAIEQATALAARRDVAGLAEPRDRIRRLHRICYGRDAEIDEVELGLRYIDSEAAESREGKNVLEPWVRYAQVLLLSNEFVFVD